MSIELTRTGVAIPNRLAGLNTMVFPRELREAIPDLPTYVGRVLELASLDGEATHTALFGMRVHLSLLVRENGKLTGEFVVRMDLTPDAARGLAETLTRLADQAEHLSAS